MDTYHVYSYTSSGRCYLDKVIASTKQDAKLRTLLSYGPDSRNTIVRQKVELEYANSHQDLKEAYFDR